MSRTYCVVPDLQMPYENRKALKALIRFIGEYQPDEVVQIGDVADFPQPSRWNKDTKGEFEGSVHADAAYIQQHFLQPLREVYSGPLGVIEGNHDLRPRDYLAKYAPALADTDAFNIETLLDFDAHEVTKLPDFYAFAPNWVMTHGHLGGIRISPIAGNTALNAAKRMGVSVIMGHTHRLGMISHSVGYDGAVVQTLTGVEVGNLMNMKAAGYLRKGAGNWQQGFALVHVARKNVQAQPIPITGGQFTVDGVSFRV